MKKLSVSALALIAAVVAAPVMQAHADQTPGFYVGAGAGANWPTDSSIHNRPDSKAFFDPGWSVNGSGGYAWDNGLRLEGEVWHSRADVDAIHGAVSNHGHLSNTDLFANGFYDFHTGTMLTPYLGVGVGGAQVDVDHIGTLSNHSSLNGNDLTFAYQGIAGAALQLDSNWAVTADYRYIATLDTKEHTTEGRGAYMDNASNNIVIGVRYSFDQPAPPPPVQAVTPPPRPMVHTATPPAVAPIPQSFMVFFDFNKSVLTPEAKRILASAAQEYKRGGFVKIVVTGHTDTVGSIAYNQKLSERRAQAVKAELVKDGLNPSGIEAVGAGKNGLLVPTADGVREAQNRRAEIVFDKQ